MLAILSPGQGAQKPGMLAPWLEESQARELVDNYSEIAQMDLVHLGCNASASEIQDTAVAQPLLVVNALLTLRALEVGGPINPDYCAGHSVGEIPAYVAAGVINDSEAMNLVARRGRAMAAAAALEPTGMCAVLGRDPEAVAAAIEAAGLVAANVNGGGQVVAAGAKANLEALAGSAPRGIRVVPLAVAGAFHTSYMESAREQVANCASELKPAHPRAKLLSNRDGEVVDDGAVALQYLVEQVTRPVRWDLCCQNMASGGVKRAIELAPGGVLTKLGKRTLPGVEMVAVTGPEDIAAARELIERDN